MFGKLEVLGSTFFSSPLQISIGCRAHIFAAVHNFNLLRVRAAKLCAGANVDISY